MQYDAQSITFLDLRVFLNLDGSLHTNLYRKDTAGNTIFHYNSSHPRSLVRSIPFSQYLRLWRNCAREEDFGTGAKALFHRLLSRGYSKKVLKRAYQKAKLNQIEEFIFKKRAQLTKNTTKVITKFSFYLRIVLFLNMSITDPRWYLDELAQSEIAWSMTLKKELWEVRAHITVGGVINVHG